jgi:hypothetical protein
MDDGCGMFMNRFAQGAVVTAALLAAAPAWSLPSDVDSPGIERGAQSIGVDIELAFDDDARDAAYEIGYERAPTDWAAFEGKLVFAHPDAEDPFTEGLELAATLAPANQSGNWRFGVKLDLFLGLEDGVDDAGEALVLAERNLGDGAFIANFGAKRAFANGAATEFEYGLRIERPYFGATIAAEILGELGTDEDFGFGDERATLFGLDYGRDLENLDFEFAVFGGLTDASPDAFVRVQIGRAF